MAASYPSAVKSFSTKTSGQTIASASTNDLQDEVHAVEDALLNGIAHPIKFTPDATHSVGMANASRPLDLFTSRDVTVGRNMVLNGSSSGALTVKAPAAAGSNTLTLPAGTTDFSATGGTSQFVQQASAGAALTVAAITEAQLPNFVAFTDYSATSTIVGWSAFSLKKILYRRMGTMVFVFVAIVGTSDNAATSFTLPLAASSSWVSNTFLPLSAQDNGATISNGVWRLQASGSTIDCFTNNAGAGWTNSGTKEIFVQFWYSL